MNKQSNVMSSTKLKIGLILDDSLDSNDGVAQYVKTLGGWLSSRGHQVSYLVGETKLAGWQDGKVFSLAKNLRVKFNGNWVSVPLLANARSIDHLLTELELDVIHVQMPYSPFLAGRIIKRAYPDTAVVGTFHIFPYGFVARFGGRLLGLVQHFSLKKFYSIVSVSSVAAGFAKSAFGISSHIVPNVVNVAFYRQYAKSKPNPANIVFLGRLVERKGCGYLIDAFHLVSESMPEACLHIAGSGSQRQSLQTKVDRLGLSQKVKFHGFVSEEQKAKLLADASIACFPSTAGESFGIVLVEAMAAGARMVLGGDNPGYRSVLGERPELLVDPKDTAALAGRLKKFLAGESSRAEAYAWQQQQLDKYDVAEIGPRIESLYEQAIANKAGSKA